MTANPIPLRLPPMPKVADLLRLYGLAAKKQLSQNFILDLNVTGMNTEKERFINEVEGKKVVK